MMRNYKLKKAEERISGLQDKELKYPAPLLDDEQLAIKGLEALIKMKSKPLRFEEEWNDDQRI